MKSKITIILTEDDLIPYLRQYCYDHHLIYTEGIKRIIESHGDLLAALEPFADGAGAFDGAEQTYGDGVVFERGTTHGTWSFTIADVRRARAAIARAKE